MHKVRPQTIAILVLSIFSLLLITIDWRASVLIALVAIVAGIARLREGDHGE